MSGPGRGGSAGPLAQLVAAVGDTDRGWVVGGAVRDALLGRPTPDLDVAVAGDAGAIAGRLAHDSDCFRFKLSDAWGAWRVAARDRSWQVDLTPLTAPTLEEDLARRDLTVNAIAQPLAAGLELGAGELIDPFGGLADLADRRLRAVGEESFAADPLRVMRLARISSELDFVADPATVALAQAAATSLRDVAAERAFTELRLLVCSERAVQGIELLRELGATGAVLPELDALRGIEQSRFHHLDVYDHTLTTLQRTIELVNDPAAVFGDQAERLALLLSEPLANELTRGQALRFGALLHDIAKSRTRGLSAEGRVTFHEHDREGSRMAVEILSRLRASDRLATHVAALTRHHLRLGFLVHERPLSGRAIYHYLAACEPVEVDVTALSVADRLATLGHNAERAVALHLELARELMGHALDWHEHRPKPPIRGDRLAAAVGLARGPELGPLLAELTEAEYAGEIAGEEQAIEYARRWLVSH